MTRVLIGARRNGEQRITTEPLTCARLVAAMVASFEERGYRATEKATARGVVLECTKSATQHPAPELSDTARESINAHTHAETFGGA